MSEDIRADFVKALKAQQETFNDGQLRMSDWVEMAAQNQQDQTDDILLALVGDKTEVTNDEPSNS